MTTDTTTDTTLRFGSCELDVAACALRVDGHRVRIEQRPFDLLLYLVQRRHRVVSSDELLEKVWPGRSVSNSSLARAVMKLRQAIGSPETPLVRTVPKVGYQFIGPADSSDAPAAPAAAAPPVTLALLPFANGTDDPALDWVALGLMTMTAEALADDRRLSLVATPSLLAALAGHDDAPTADRAAAVQRSTGAQLVVHGAVRRSGKGYRLDFRGYGAARGIEGSASAPWTIELASALAQALTTSLFQASDPDPADDQHARFRDPMAGEAYARGLQMAAEQRWMAALHLIRMALELEPGHRSVKLELLRALAAIATDGAEVEPLGAELLELAGAGEDHLAAMRVHQALGRFHLNRNAFGLAESHLKQALDLAERCESFDGIVRTLLISGTTSAMQCNFADAREYSRRARELCEYSGNRLLALGVLNMDACLAGEEDQVELMLQLSMDLARRARTLRAHEYLVNACGNASTALAELGRLAEAAVFAEESFAAALALGDRRMIDSGAGGACWVYYLADAPQAAARLLAELDAVRSPVYEMHSIWCARGFHAAASGDAVEAAHCFGTALQMARESGQSRLEQQLMPRLIEALVLTDRLDEARAEIEHADSLAAAGRWEMPIHLLLVQALLAHREGRPGLALELLDRVVAARPAPLWQAWACADAAWMLAEAGDAGASVWLARIDASLATLPLVLAVRARVLHASGNIVAAHATHQQGMAARNAGRGHDYFARLSEVYAGHANGSMSAAELPRAPALPSRL